MSNPLPPAERFANILRIITHAAVTQRLLGRIGSALNDLIVNGLRTAIQEFARIAAMANAGTWRPRRAGLRRRSGSPRPPPPRTPRQKFGWLADVLPEAAAHRGHLCGLLEDKEMQALVATAPAAMRRLLRPLYWALKLKPPPILAIPRKAKAEAPAAPSPPQPAPPPGPGLAAPRPPRRSPPRPAPAPA